MKELLEKQRSSMIMYLLMKVDTFDWHGVADAAMDLREIEAKLGILEIQEREKK
jgi:hypothetical protein